MVYEAETIWELDITRPEENCKPSEVNDAIREISRVLSNEFNVKTVSTNTTLDKTHGLVLVNASGGNITIALPSASTVTDKRYIIKKIDNSSNWVAIEPFGGQTIDGQLTITLSSQYSCISIASDGTSDWKEIRVQNAINAINTINADYATNASSIRDKARNLVIKNNATNPTSIVDITVDEVVLQDTSNPPKSLIARNISVSANITVSGLNGLDTGTEAPSTWYHIWFVSNGTTTASLLSTSTTAPTMPAGYTYKAYLGAIYNNSSSNFISIYQTDNKVNREEISFEFSSNLWSLLDLSTAIPPTAKKVSGTLEGKRLNIGATSVSISPIDGNVGEVGIQGYIADIDLYKIKGFYSILLKTSQTIYVIASVNGGGKINITQWEY